RDPSELERPKGPVVVIGRPAPTPQPVPAAPPVHSTPAAPQPARNPQEVATNTRPETPDATVVSPSLVDRQPDVRTAPPVTKVNPPASPTIDPATRPVESAAGGTDASPSAQPTKS